jgi:hypothetical protein
MPLKAEPGETIDEYRGAFFTMRDVKVRIACGITNLALVQLAASRKSTLSDLAAVFYGYRDVIESIAVRKYHAGQFETDCSVLITAADVAKI